MSSRHRRRQERSDHGLPSHTRRSSSSSVGSATNATCQAPSEPTSPALSNSPNSKWRFGFKTVAIRRRENRWRWRWCRRCRPRKSPSKSSSKIVIIYRFLIRIMHWVLLQRVSSISYRHPSLIFTLSSRRTIPPPTRSIITPARCTVFFTGTE